MKVLASMLVLTVSPLTLPGIFYIANRGDVFSAVIKYFHYLLQPASTVKTFCTSSMMLILSNQLKLRTNSTLATFTEKNILPTIFVTNKRDIENVFLFFTVMSKYFNFWTETFSYST